MPATCTLRRIATHVTLALLAGLLAGCGDSGVTGVLRLPAGARLVIGPATPTLVPDLTQQMLAVVTDAEGTPLDVQARWTSSDPAVAPISPGGLVVASHVGAATLTATVGPLTAVAHLVVQAAPVTSAQLLEHPNVVATVFWVGEGADATNGFISNTQSAFDAAWLAHFGGIDAPGSRRGYLPAGFTPLENPFYFALPYSDIDDAGVRKQNAPLVVPWALSRVVGPTESLLKNRWIRITAPQSSRTCYAQWEDAGPGLYDDFQYVFGTAAPANPFPLAGLASASALDISPAVRDCLGLSVDVMRLTWQFVADADVPAGPWMDIVTRSPGTR